MTFGAEEIVDLRPEVDNVGQVASQKIMMIRILQRPQWVLSFEEITRWWGSDADCRYQACPPSFQSPTQLVWCGPQMERRSISDKIGRKIVDAKNLAPCIICCRSASPESRSQQPAWQLYRYLSTMVAMIQTGGNYTGTYLSTKVTLIHTDWQLYLLVETFSWAFATLSPRQKIALELP